MVNNNPFEKYKLILVFILALASVMGLIFFISTAYKMQKQITAERHELASLKSEVEALDKILKDKSVYEPKTKKVTGSLPSSYGEVAFFVEELERLATQSGLPIRLKIDQNAKKEKNQLASVGLSFSSEGNYIGYTDILSLLAGLPFHTKIDSIKMENQAGAISSIIDLKVFIWQENK